MDLTVEIDPGSGFCGGVIRAIRQAEAYLGAPDAGPLWSLGPIVHNEEEQRRLGAQGLREADASVLESGTPLPAGATLLIRAHGEPPRTYRLAAERGYTLIDCTCPVVLKLQRQIQEAYARLRDRGGRIVIFGKTGHAEILGLVGQVGGDALVVEDAAMLEAAFVRGELRPDVPVELFSQTTKDPQEYRALAALLRSRLADPALLAVHDTVCSQVANRHAALAGFAAAHDAVVFVAGRASSNGRVLCALCRSVNPRTWQVSAPEEIDPGWFRDGDRVGVCGATSTPKWLLERTAARIATL